MLINISFQEKVLNAGSGGRTHTVSPPRDFESRTSANSIMPAYLYNIKIKAPNTKSVKCLKRKERDSNPRTGISRYTSSSRAP